MVPFTESSQATTKTRPHVDHNESLPSSPDEKQRCDVATTELKVNVRSKIIQLVQIGMLFRCRHVAWYAQPLLSRIRQVDKDYVI